MAQHDYNIANQTGLEFRADLNDLAEAIVTQNSGPTEPTVTYAGMKWLDTSTSPPIEKRRNAANSAWETTLTEAGRSVAGAADAAAQRTVMGAAASTNPSFTGRITGDFSNATVANRVMFQTSAANTATVVGTVPNGISRYAYQAIYNTSNGADASWLQFGVNGINDVTFRSDVTGVGTYLPMTFYTGGAERMRIDISGNVLVTTPALLGYGSGAGGTVVQSTSKSTAVTLNKPTGRVLTHDAALAGGASITFILFNSLCSSTTTPVVTVGNNSNYIVACVNVAEGAFMIQITNRTASSQSEVISINFSLIGGATS